jgi:predicted dehydrogenase
VLKVGLIGCGGRGTGAAINALSADPHTQITALGDAFADRADSCLQTLQENTELASRVLVDRERVFSGFDAYKNVIDSGVDVVILASPPHFRPRHLAYAVDQGKHCFVEKPIAVDVPGSLEVKQTCELAATKGLSIVSGLCWRYEPGVVETIDRVKSGAIGDIIAIESCYNAGPLWHRGDESSWSRMEYQLRNWPYYTWLSGDHITEQAIHSLDKTAWLLDDASPVKARGIGGRQQRTEQKYGNVFDHHVVFYEYANGVPVYFTCRQQENCSTLVDECVLGTKGKAWILANRIAGEKKWKYRGTKPNMYQVEHEALFQSIRNGKPVNDGHLMTNSTLISIMGRLATYTGQDLTWEQTMRSSERLGPDKYEWSDMPEPEVAIPGKTPLVLAPAEGQLSDATAST